MSIESSRGRTADEVARFFGQDASAAVGNRVSGVSESGALLAHLYKQEESDNLSMESFLSEKFGSYVEEDDVEVIDVPPVKR